MRTKGSYMLKITGGIAVAAGILLMFFGFYFMASAMSFDNMTPEQYEANRQSLHVLQLMGIYILVFGVIYAVSGFIGILNADHVDEAKKCMTCGKIMLLISAIGVVGLVVLTQQFQITHVILTVGAFLVAGLYVMGAWLNMHTGIEK